MGIFELLPLACVINGKYFCVSGGISPDFEKVEKLDVIERVNEIPRGGVMCDLLWSDPVEGKVKMFEDNEAKDSGFLYG